MIHVSALHKLSLAALPSCLCCSSKRLPLLAASFISNAYRCTKRTSIRRLSIIPSAG